MRAEPRYKLKLGFMMLPRSLEETRATAAYADSAGWDWMGVADSPVVYGDSYVHQAAALAETSRIKVGPLVSHVVIRHPVVVANLLATLNELGDGRAVGTLATGNSAARGLGMKPASLDDLRDAVAAIRGYWRGDGGTYRGSRIPASGLTRAGCPLLIAADGPAAADLAGEIGDGMLYGGTLERSVVERRIVAGKHASDQSFWIAPAVSLGTTREEVLAEMGAMLVAQANRALRGKDLDERGVPLELQGEIRALWRTYDYAFHADSSRPRNAELMSPQLASYLLDHFVLWGDDAAWRSRLDEFAGAGCDGVMLILGQERQYEIVRAVTARLSSLGLLDAGAVPLTVGGHA